MIAVPDEASLAAMRVLGERLGRRCGGSTGHQPVGLRGADRRDARRAGETGSIVSLLCDPGERYLESFFDDGWIRERGLKLGPCRERVEAFFAARLEPPGLGRRQLRRADGRAMSPILRPGLAVVAR